MAVLRSAAAPTHHPNFQKEKAMDLESPKGDKVVVAIVILAVLMLIAQIIRYLVKN